MELLKIFTACMEVSHNKEIQLLLAKYIPENANQFRIDAITTRETMPLGSTWYNEEWKHNIHKNEYTKSEIYLDAPISLCLYYNDSIVALISGMLWGHNEFVICQMQAISSHVYTGHGVKKPNITNPILQTFNRQELLYESLVTILQQQGVTGIYIQPGDMNPRTTTMYISPERNEYHKDYVEVTTDIPHLSKKIAHQLYDVFAEEHGCVQDKSGFWKVENQYVVHKGKKNHITKKPIKVSL